MKKHYKTLVDLPGAPSHEKWVRQFMHEELSKVSKEIHLDNLGSIFGQINDSSGPKVMIAGHMDEVGAMIIGIESNGLIKMINLGGIKGDVFLSQHMNIVLPDGTLIPGVTASKPPHLTRGSKEPDSAIDFSSLRLDIGVRSRQEALELGIEIGLQVVPSNNYTVTANGQRIISKAWDNRFGCGMALDIAQDVDPSKLDCQLYCGATVQEEVGLRGAQTSTNMIKPDIFLAVDCSPCADVFGGDEVGGHLGKGFMVRFYDPVALMHQGIKNHILTLAKKHNIDFQYYRSMGGTDAAKAQLQQSGVIVATIGMPARYIHSTTSMIDVDDYKAVKAILLELVYSLNNDSLATIKQHV